MRSAVLDHGASRPPDEARTVVVAVEIRLYREAIARTIATSSGLRFAGDASSAHELSALVSACRPDVALVDVSMVGALEAVRRIATVEPRTRVLALGLPRREEDVLAAAEFGVAGFIGADSSLSDLVAAVNMVINGEAPCTGQIAAALLRRVAATASDRTLELGLDELTLREREILELVDGPDDHRRQAADLQRPTGARRRALRPARVSHWPTDDGRGARPRRPRR